MSLYELFLFGEATVEQLVQDAQQKVRWAAEPVVPGESIGAQILKAAKALGLDYGITRRAWYGLGVGPVTYPIIFNAWADLVDRRERAASNSPWAQAAQPRRSIPRITEVHARRVFTKSSRRAAS